MSLGCRWACAWTAVNLEWAKRAATKAANANLPGIDDSVNYGRRVVVVKRTFKWNRFMSGAAFYACGTSCNMHHDYLAQLYSSLISSLS